MATGDDRYIPGEPTNFKDVQEMLRDIWEVLHTLEGRLSTINLRSGINVAGSGAFTGDLSTEGSVTLDNFIQVNEREFDRLGVLTPAVSPVGSSRIYQDPTSDTLKVSQNGAAYQDLVFVPAELSKCHVFNNANISIADATLTALTFNSESYDVGGMHSTAVDTARITFPAAGTYTIIANIIFASNATGIRQIRFRINGATFILMHNFGAVTGNETTTGAVVDYLAAAGDYVECMVYQDSGGPLDVSFIDSRSPRFMAHKLP